MANLGMYKQKINKKNILIIILWVFWLCVFGVQWWLIWDFLSETSSKLTDEDYIHTIWWKAIVTNLYYKSLSIAKTNEVSAIENAIKRSVDYMKSIDPKCNLNKTDMLNIMYNSNDSFRRSFRQNITNNYKGKPQYPTNEEYLDACHIFMWCFYWISDYQDSPYIRQNCSAKANEIYYQMYINYSSIANFDQINFADDIFWNAKLDDADYDLLYDIDVIWKILFEWSKSPPEVLYYQFPDINSLWDEMDSVPLYDATIDRFSPYDPADFPDIVSWLNTWSNTWNFNKDNWLVNNKINNQQNVLLQEESVDNEVQKFLESNSLNSYWENKDDDSNILNGNICITWFDTIWDDEEILSSWELIKQYLSGLIKEINKNRVKPITSITTWWESFINWESTTLTWDKTEIIKQINDQVEILSNIDDPVSQQAIQSCIDKCDWLAIDDKIICIVKCTCTEFSSPEYNDILKAWTFKIKFCMVPVQNKWFSKNGKTVYSIEEIFNEISAILISLRDSGELLVSRKTKEFLESSTTKNKFWKIFSFSINSSFKSLFTNPSKEAEQQEEENFLKNLQSSTLWFHTDLNSKEEKGKYMVTYSSLSDISNNEIIQSSAFGKTQGLSDIVDPSKLLQENRLIKLNGIISQFLQTHTAFWLDALDMMNELNRIAEALSNKKK